MKKHALIKVFFTVAILQVFNTVFKAQEISIKIAGVTTEKVTLLELEGEKTSEIDSVFSQNGSFQFSLENSHNGLYRIQFDKIHWLDFINDGESVEIETEYNSIIDSIKVIKSESNSLYYKFLKINKNYKTKTDLLNLILARYPKDDKYYQITKAKLKETKNEYLNFVQNKSQSNPKSFIARFIRTSQLPVIQQNLEIDKQLEYLKSHALDKVDFNDVELIYSDAFTNKTIEYLTYYRNPQLPKELLEKEFMKAVDTLLNKAKVNQLVYQHITEYLIDGFKKFGFDKIIDYIVENYVIEDDLCLDEKTENSIQKRIDQAKTLNFGNKVPNIILPDFNGKIIDLSKINTEKTLLVFYVSWCPHCQELLPKLNEFVVKNKEIEILAISLDSKKADWLEFIKENCSNLTNINDPNGWDGELASSYFIFATPTMFLLDKEKKIIGKATTFKEFQAVMLKL